MGERASFDAALVPKARMPSLWDGYSNSVQTEEMSMDVSSDYDSHELDTRLERITRVVQMVSTLVSNRVELAWFRWKNTIENDGRVRGIRDERGGKRPNDQTGSRDDERVKRVCSR